MDSKTIERIVILAKEYIKQGYENNIAIKMAQQRINEKERIKYEKA